MTALFGGSFDPIHFGHLNLAIEIKEKLKLKKIVFCPTRISPFKQKNPPKTSPEDRFKMIKIAIKGIDGFDATNIEIKKDEVSYTINTLDELQEITRLIVSDDMLDTFHLWKDYKKILKRTSLIVGTRKNILERYENKYFSIPKKCFIRTNIFEISSTDVRNRLKKRLYCNHLLPKEVLDYICKNGLYL